MDNVVAQSNALISAHYKQNYTIQEQRTVLWVISEIHKEDYFNGQYKNKSIRISSQKYAEIMGISVKNVYRDAKEIGERLMSKVLKLETEKGWEMFHWFSSMEYIKTEAVIDVVVSNKVIPHIIDLKSNFTKFKLNNILFLNSSYAIKLYQILAQFKSLGVRTIQLDDLRSMLGIELLKTYQLYGKIKSKILEISKKEINKNTDLTISYIEIKKGRKVDSIKFTITDKNELPEDSDQSSCKLTQNKYSSIIKTTTLEEAKKLIVIAGSKWDLYALVDQFHAFIDKKGFPQNIELAFLGFVRKKIKTHI